MIKMQGRPRILIFVSESFPAAKGLLALAGSTITQTPDLNADVACVICDKRDGKVQEVARQLKIPFDCSSGPTSYKEVAKYFKACFALLYHWEQPVYGLETAKTINSCPALMPPFGWPGMHRRQIHEKVLDSFHCGEVKCSGFTVHFQNGPTIYQSEVPIFRGDTPDILAARIAEKEQWVFPFVINLVVYQVIECLRDAKGRLYTHWRNPFFQRMFAHQAGNRNWNCGGGPGR